MPSFLFHCRRLSQLVERADRFWIATQTGEWMLIASGILTVLFGVAIVLFPLGGVLAIAWMISATASSDVLQCRIPQTGAKPWTS